jgi:multiple sugar transport system substrate-binding protein
MKRVLTMMACMVMLITLFAGCNSQGTSNTPTAAPTTAPTTAATPTPTPKPTGPESFKGEFTWWTFFDQAPYLKAEFEKKYPNVKIKLETFGGSQYQTKLMTTLLSQQGIPDMFDLEEGYVYKFIDSPLIADLSKLGGNELIKDFYPWAAEMGKDSKGTLKAICDNVSPVAFWYLRDAMQKWLGTSDPDQIAEKLSDWDKITAVAKEVKEKSNSTVYLWPNLNEIVKIEGYSITPFVRDRKFSIDPKWYDVIKIMRNLNDQGLVANLGSWGGDWANKWNSGELLIRTMPSWDFFTDWKKNTGNVGVAKPPKCSYSGGTYRVIYDKSEKKAIAAEFLKFLTNVDYQIGNLNDNNQMPAITKVFSQIGANYKSEKFGNQNILKTYNEICTNIPKILPDMYTRDVQNKFAKYCEEGIKKGQTDEQIITEFKKAVKDAYPDVQGL